MRDSFWCLLYIALALALGAAFGWLALCGLFCGSAFILVWLFWSVTKELPTKGRDEQKQPLHGPEA